MRTDVIDVLSPNEVHRTAFVPIVPAHFIIVKLLFGFFVSRRAKPMRAARSRARNAEKVLPAVSKRGFFFSLALRFHLFFMARKWETV